jgi:hypothetical protein
VGASETVRVAGKAPGDRGKPGGGAYPLLPRAREAGDSKVRTDARDELGYVGGTFDEHEGGGARRGEGGEEEDTRERGPTAPARVMEKTGDLEMMPQCRK